MTLVLGGDGIKTIDQVREALEGERPRPVVIVTGSSRVPTLLAELFYVLEDKVPRSVIFIGPTIRYTPARTDTNLLSAPRRRICFGYRRFSVAAPTIWNSLFLTLAIVVQ